MKALSILSLFCLSLIVVPFAAAESDQLVALQQENRLLQRQVKKLEAQVDAMREEMNQPGAERIISGLGYIVGVFGITGWVAASRKKRGEK
ncbi:hypothetical protein SAMN02745165_00921 [Malonomonas rubra DSM 5091]|uniref:Uncharacterized protein n=1 Tax=Malonomonas rubra DSM 5091 TaxID=1122189 RepID=A0A1M6E413_MALRU|nr:hypothetical protein [Malonomonas rubra]SHI79998.1 hypothetical protein SAMN02745165_00921 [Malonomonas rubra DSM 5091]